MEFALNRETRKPGQYDAGLSHALGYRRPIIGRHPKAGQSEKGRAAWPVAIIAAFVEVEKFHHRVIVARHFSYNLSNLRCFSR